MKNAIILHGMPSKEEYFNPEIPCQSNMHWIPWVQKQLTLAGIATQTPEFPDSFEPIYEKWLSVFEQYSVDENTILIGHSCGGGFLVRWLTENKIKVGEVVLVAPFLDPDHDEVPPDFFDFTIKNDISQQTKSLTLFYSTNDEREILDSVNQILLADKNIQVKKFTDKGHFVLEHMGTEKFPELVEFIFGKGI